MDTAIVLDRFSEFYDCLRYSSKADLIKAMREHQRLRQNPNTPAFLHEDIDKRIDALNDVLRQLDEASQAGALPSTRTA